MLKLVDIRKDYLVDKEEVTHALNGVSIEFRENEFVSILGPSGCGKTTLLNIVGGLDRYTSGDIQIDGVSTKEYDDVDWDTYRNRRIGFVFQSYNLIPHMNILKNVAMSLTLAGVSAEEQKKRALEALDKVGLKSQAKKRPNQLSGGQMQRVAIARALVNNPHIILADEPTGALDSESGIQIMELLKEVAKDRLVIMVTHNPMLAEEYSTRIIYLKDGEVDGDTMPYDSAKEDSVKEADNVVELNGEEANDRLVIVEDEVLSEDDNKAVSEDEVLNDIEIKDGEIKEGQELLDDGETEKAAKPLSRFQKFIRMLKKGKQQEKSAMKLSTAINLSWSNLLGKKGRTLLTSIAGSIGIIGIILVLSLSNGASLYIKGLEKNALSNYPLSVSRVSMNVGSLMTTLTSIMATSKDDVDDDVIKTQKVLGAITDAIKNESMSSNNDLKAFKSYVDKNFDTSLANVRYSYGTSFNAYIADPKSDTDYMKVNPYSENMYELFDKIIEEMPFLNDPSLKISIMGQELGIADALQYIGTSFGDPWMELADSKSLLNSQYELLGNSRWPEKANEIVIIAGENNVFYDYQLFMLGLKSTADILEAIGAGSDAFVSSAVYPVEQLIGMEYKIMTNADYLIQDKDDDGNPLETYTQHNRTETKVDFVDERAMRFADGTKTVKVVGVIRPKEGGMAMVNESVIGYTSALTQAMFEHAANTPAVKAIVEAATEALDEGKSTYRIPAKFSYRKTDGTMQEINYWDDISVRSNDSDSDDMIGSQHEDALRSLGVVDVNVPMQVSFYCTSFESKEAVEKFIKQYEADTNTQIKYEDSLSTMMTFVNTMASTITGVLVAFAAISLVVSTIMISIIIYTSVLERRKEIGVLRSIGARKKDVTRVFLAESAILGAYSGVIGILVSVILSFSTGAILEKVVHIRGLMSLEWWHCLMMLAISIVLSMLAGFIPARIAAKKDPAIALRSE